MPVGVPKQIKPQPAIKNCFLQKNQKGKQATLQVKSQILVFCEASMLWLAERTEVNQKTSFVDCV